MKLPITEELQKIYGSLEDSISRKIYRHRLLYSLLGETEEISQMAYECSPAGELLRSCKICYYGAGAGARWLVQDDRRARFIIDKYKTGTLSGLPIISFEDFLRLPDCREYLIIITVEKEIVQHEIVAELESHALRYIFGYKDLVRFDLQYFDLQQLNLYNEYFVDAGAFDGQTTKYFLKWSGYHGGGAHLCA